MNKNKKLNFLIFRQKLDIIDDAKIDILYWETMLYSFEKIRWQYNRQIENITGQTIKKLVLNTDNIICNIEECKKNILEKKQIKFEAIRFLENFYNLTFEKIITKNYEKILQLDYTES